VDMFNSLRQYISTRYEGIFYRITILLLICLGMSQGVGHLLQWNLAENIGEISRSSPLPLVFSAGSYEYYASNVVIEVTLDDGSSYSQKLKPGDIHHISGPFARYNAYALVLTYFPDLPGEIVAPYLRYGFCRSRLLWPEKVPENSIVQEALIMVSSNTSGDNRRWQLRFICQ